MLIGDHQQLGTPTQGAHTGIAQLSALELGASMGSAAFERELLRSPVFVGTLRGQGSGSPRSGVRAFMPASTRARLWDTPSDIPASVPPHIGVFLETTFRLPPAVCSAISQSFYNSKLRHPSQPSSGASWSGQPGPAVDTHGTLLVARSQLFGTPAPSPDMGVDGIGSLTAEVPVQGFHFLPVRHVSDESSDSHSSSSEAATVARFLSELMRTHVLVSPSDPASGGPSQRIARDIEPEDVLVIAPYNNQVRAIRQALEGVSVPGASAAGDAVAGEGRLGSDLSRVRVGTVDRFQGQQAPIVVLSTTLGAAEAVAGPGAEQKQGAVDPALFNVLQDDSTAPTPEAALGDDPGASSRLSARHVSFVMDQARLNVALSRSMCLAVVAGSRTLLTAPAHSVDQLRLASFLMNVCYGSRALEVTGKASQ